MTNPPQDPPARGAGSTIQFNSPLSDTRADRLIAELTAHEPATVADYGCGWGEFLLRTVQAAPAATGLGIDVHAPDIERAIGNAESRGLHDRVTLVAGEAADHLRPADLVISSGAYQAFGDIRAALAALRDTVNPGGRLLFAAEFWQTPPTAQQLDQMWDDISADDCTDLAGLVDHAAAAGLRPLKIETATRDEWEEFESGNAADRERWLLTNSHHPKADEVRADLDEHRSIWLRGHRDVMGYAYLTLGVVR